ncbi:hypothetical protein LJR225_001457 [Phenylobacterium sp. LjRoot225]|uniref:hypothetical protein n=1 Tax=Phenylobacterium sp. LjRoot225 TaxID=3342285 RepID=UPI003ED15D96
MAPLATVFVITMRAIAGPENSQPDGRDYDLLVFARADTEAEAERVAFQGLGQLGWIDPQALRSGEITDPDAVPDDLLASFARALEDGCAVIVYDEP